MHITPQVRRKGICYIKPVINMLLFDILIEDARVVTAVQLESIDIPLAH